MVQQKNNLHHWEKTINLWCTTMTSISWAKSQPAKQSTPTTKICCFHQTLQVLDHWGKLTCSATNDCFAGWKVKRTNLQWHITPEVTCHGCSIDAIDTQVDCNSVLPSSHGHTFPRKNQQCHKQKTACSARLHNTYCGVKTSSLQSAQYYHVKIKVTWLQCQCNWCTGWFSPCCQKMLHAKNAISSTRRCEQHKNLMLWVTGIILLGLWHWLGMLSLHPLTGWLLLFCRCLDTAQYHHHDWMSHGVAIIVDANATLQCKHCGSTLVQKQNKRIITWWHMICSDSPTSNFWSQLQLEHSFPDAICITTSRGWSPEDAGAVMQNKMWGK